MTTILSDRTTSARKSYRCEHCCRPIEVGQRYRKQVYVDGDLQTYRAHEDCDNAASAWMAIADLDPRYDDPILLYESVCREDHDWLLKEYPAVAARLGIVLTSA